MEGTPPVPDPPNGWSRFERVIVYRLDKLDEDLLGMRSELRQIRNDEIGKLKIELAMLKVKSGAWGAIAGFLPAAIVAIYLIASGH